MRIDEGVASGVMRPTTTETAPVPASATAMRRTVTTGLRFQAAKLAPTARKSAPAANQIRTNCSVG